MSDYTMQSVLQVAQEQLQLFATTPEFEEKMQVAFGEGVNVASLQDVWTSGSLGTLPEIEVRPAAEMNGARGAFAAATNTIYLAQELLTEDVEQVAQVFLEEYGHYLDSLLTPGDAPGDEGAIFAEVVRGNGLTSSDVAELKAEGDTATVSLDGEAVEIEQADNNGDIFQSESIISTNADDAQAQSVYATDIDGDGDMDVLSASSGDGKIAWYENTDGLGTFSSEKVISTDSSIEYILATNVYAADIDGDRDMDVLSASSGRVVDGKIAWYENTDGLGTFSSPKVISLSGVPSGEQVRDIYVSDLDGDEDIDVLSFSEFIEDRNFKNRIVWYENTDGQGTFSSEKVISTDFDLGSSLSVHADDLDGDGDIDVLSGSRNKIAWYENIDDQKTFSSQKVISTNVGRSGDVYTSDLDRDGDIDVLSASIDDHKIAWYENSDGQGTFSSRKVISTTSDSPTSVHADDLDGDGDMDVLSASPFASNDQIAWYENIDDQKTFSSQKVISTNADGASDVYTSDLDRDGDIDVLSAFDNKIAWYKNTTNTTTQQPGVSIIESDGSTDVTEGQLASFDTYDVVLNTKPDHEVKIKISEGVPNTFALADDLPDLYINTGEEGEDGRSILTFEPQEWFIPQTVTVSAFNDTDSEGSHSSSIGHTVRSDDEDYDGIIVGEPTVNITDDDDSRTIVLNGDNLPLKSPDYQEFGPLLNKQVSPIVKGEMIGWLDDEIILGQTTADIALIALTLVGGYLTIGLRATAGLVALDIATDLRDKPGDPEDTDLIAGLVPPGRILVNENEEEINPSELPDSLTVQPGEELSLIATILPGLAAEEDTLKSLRVNRLFRANAPVFAGPTFPVEVAKHNFDGLDKSQEDFTFLIKNIAFSEPDLKLSQLPLAERTTVKATAAVATNYYQLKITTINGEEQKIAPIKVEEPKNGSAQKGFITNGTVFLDVNQDRILNGNEAFSTTAPDGSFSFPFTSSQFESFDSNGNGELDPSEGTLILESGTQTTDISTGLTLENSLTAPATATVITPLTTLVSELMAQGQDLAEAENTVKTTFGIHEDIELINFNTIRQANGGNSRASTVFASEASVYDTVTQIAHFLSGASSASVAEVGNTVFSVIAQQLSNANFDLTTASTLETIINEVVTSAGISLSSEQNDVVDEVASIIAAGQQRISDLQPNDPQTFLQEVTKIQKVSEGNVADALQGLGEDPSTAQTVLDNNTGANLDNQIANAEIGNIFPPEIEDASFTLDTDIAQGDVIGTVPASDADGDSLTFSITSGNPDLDGDGTLGIAIDNTGQLTIADSDDIDGSPLQLGVLATEEGRDDNSTLQDAATVNVNFGTHLDVLEEEELEGDSGTTSFTFTVTRPNNATGEVTYNYEVTGSGENPANADDFGGTFPSGTVTFEETQKKITVEVTGDSGFEPHEDFTLTLTNPDGGLDTPELTATAKIVNDDNAIPTVAQEIPDQTTIEDQEFSFTIPDNAFTDPNFGDPLTLSATSVPDWLTFDPETNTFSGTPNEGNVGTIQLEVTATDTLGATVSNTFELTVNEAATEPNEITGTPGRDELTGTSANDSITGSFGRDIITTGGGNDEIVYANLRNAGDIITDFEVGSDQIVFTEVLESVGYAGSDAIADGYVEVVEMGSSSVVQIDPDGPEGRGIFRPFAIVENVAATDLSAASNFAF